jgi:hypothetical protein
MLRALAALVIAMTLTTALEAVYAQVADDGQTALARTGKGGGQSDGGGGGG